MINTLSLGVLSVITLGQLCGNQKSGIVGVKPRDLRQLERLNDI